MTRPSQSQRWRETIENEVDDLAVQNILEYKKLPAGREAIGSKRVFKINKLPTNQSSVVKQDLW